MSVNDTPLSLCNLALADIGTRSKITDLPPPLGGGTDPSTEAYFCGLYFADVRDHLLRAARWNFGKRDEQLYLWKASPGTNENPFPLPNRTSWNVAYPAPPWMYSYNYPGNALFVQRILGPSPQTSISPPIFSGTTNLLTAYPRVPYSRFEVATDNYDASGNPFPTSSVCSLVPTPTVVSGGSGYQIGDLICLVNSQYQGQTGAIGPAGIPQSVMLTVTAIGPGGAVTGIHVAVSGSYASSPPNPLGQAATTGAGTGATFNITWTTPATLFPGVMTQKVILTNVQGAVAEYTRNDTIPTDWEPQFVTAFYAAMAGKLAQVLTGDKALSRGMLDIANTSIINARVVDGNEALTIDEHVPDWLRLRGVGGGLGFEDYFFAPYGPLFPTPPPF